MQTSEKEKNIPADVVARGRKRAPVLKAAAPVQAWIEQMRRAGDAVRELVEQQPDLQFAGAQSGPTATVLEAVGTQMNSGFPRQDVALMWAIAEGDDDVLKWDQAAWHWALTGRRLMTAIDESRGPAPMESPEAWMQKAQELHAEVFVETKHAEPGVWRYHPHWLSRETSRDEVKATMCVGYEHILHESEPLVRSAMVEFLVTTVHPFSTGSSRLARLLANRETLRRRILMRGPLFDPYSGTSEYFESMANLWRDGEGNRWAANLMNWQRASGDADGCTVLETMRNWAGQLWSPSTTRSDERLQEYRACMRSRMSTGPNGPYGSDWPREIVKLAGSRDAGDHDSAAE